MPKMDLAAQISSMQYNETDSEDFDEIVGSSVVPAQDGKTLISHIPMDLLVEYKDEQFESLTGRPQPFNAYSQEDLETLAKSIYDQGVINPITVRPMNDGRYQILAGRNRTRAAKIAGKTEMPCIVRDDIDDVNAVLIMLDTNLEQRHKLSYSEKAYAYKMRLDLKKSQGKRTDLQEGAEKVDTLSEIGAQNKESRRTVAYLVRLTHLIPELLQMVDSGKINFKTGVGISYLSEYYQRYLLNEIIPLGIKIKNKHITELRELEDCSCEDVAEIKQVFFKPQTVSLSTVTISGTKLNEYADIIKDEKHVEKLFFEFLEAYRKNSVQQVH